MSNIPSEENAVTFLEEAKNAFIQKGDDKGLEILE